MADNTTATSTLEATNTAIVENANMWLREKVLVEVIPEEQVKTFTRKPLIENSTESSTKKEIELMLTPPIIIVWAYQLAFALSQGCFRFDYD